MQVGRWASAVAAYITVFAFVSWAWEYWRLPPAGPDRATVAIGVASVIAAAIGGPIYWWAGREETEPNFRRAGHLHQRDGWLEDLKIKMRTIWINEALRGSLETIAAIELGFLERTEAVSVPMRRRRVDEAPRDFPRGTRLSAIYDLDESERRLLLLGEPGSGKTTQLLHLAEELLDRATQDPSAPVPVYLSLSAGEWHGIVVSARRRTELPEAIRWFSEQISDKYQIPAARVVTWLEAENSPIILLLDGLDEVKEKAGRIRCVRALSHGRVLTNAGMVVACRTEDYHDIGEVLNFGTAIEILPLVVSDIENYLSWSGDNLKPLRRAVSADKILATLLNTPLMLCIAALAYKDRIEIDILTGSLHDRRDRLWSSYVSAMTSRNRDPQSSYLGNPRFSAKQTERYLVFLARELANRRATDFNPNYFDHKWLPSPWDDVLGAVAAARAFGAAGALLVIGWHLIRPASGATVTVVAMSFGLICGYVGLIILLRTCSEPATAWKWSWNSAGQTVAYSGAWGAAIAVALGIFGGPPAIVFGGLWGAAAGLSLGAISGWQPVKSGTKIRHRQSINKILVKRFATTCIGVSLMTGLLAAAYLRHSSNLGRALAIDAGVSAGFFGAALYFSFYVFLDYHESRFVASALGLFPLRMNQFIIHAHERILLRRVGRHYRFLHLGLQDFLAISYSGGGRTSTPDRTSPILGLGNAADDGPVSTSNIRTALTGPIVAMPRSLEDAREPTLPDETDQTRMS